MNRSLPVPTEQSPPLEIDLVGGGRLVLAEDEPERFTDAAFYGGSHRPIHRGDLIQLDRAVDNLAGIGVEVVVVSGDDERRACRSVAEWHSGKLRVGDGQSVNSMTAARRRAEDLEGAIQRFAGSGYPLRGVA